MITPKVALAIDALCWTGGSIAFFYFGWYWAAATTGAFGLVYMVRAVRVMLRIIKIEQEMKAFMLSEEIDDERDYH